MIPEDFRYEFERFFKSKIDKFIETLILCELPAENMMALGHFQIKRAKPAT